MKRTPEAPHPDTLEAAVAHFNERFRHRYRLPEARINRLREVVGLEDELADLATVRAEGVADASCALIARVVLSTVPRYAIGTVLGDGTIHVQYPRSGDEESYRGRSVLLVNPIGGVDNWINVTRWLRRYAGTGARRRELASLASEKRPDEAANDELLREAAATHERAITLPPDEAFSGERAAEVSFIYDVPVETLRAWKQRHRAGLAAKKPGAPRKNR